MLDLYRPGQSALHRMRPGWKLLALFLVGTTLFVFDALPVAVAAGLITLLLYRLAGLSWTEPWLQLRSMWWIFGLLLAFQLWLVGPYQAVFLCIRLAVLVAFASLVTLSTRSSDMIDALITALKPLRRIGINPDKIALAFSLVLRFIPVLARMTEEVREAQKARGLERSVLAIGIPLAVRTLKMADDISDAIDARGYDP